MRWNKLTVLVFVLMMLISLCCRQGRKPGSDTDEAYLNVISQNDMPLDPPQVGDWLYTHKEKGQSFEKYLRKNPNTVTDSLHTIYLKPIGRFGAADQVLLENARRYAEIFFQTKTVLLPATDDRVIDKPFRRIHNDNNEQLLAGYILDSVLKPAVPKGAVALLAITEKDLYPKDDWNFVFGLASYQQRVGVSSMYRFFERYRDSISAERVLRRLTHVVSHEIGHMFSMAHCIEARCVMNGANSLAEMDRTPNRLCSACQRKLHSNFRYDHMTRLNQLLQYLQEYNLHRDAQDLQRDFDACKQL